MKVKLCFLIAWLVTTICFAQGTFRYRYMGDTSPWNLYAEFQASEEAVATGFLSMTNTSNQILKRDQQTAPLNEIRMPVDPITGAFGDEFAVYGWIGRDAYGIFGGTTHPISTVIFWPYMGDNVDSQTDGRWIVSYDVPEPSVAALIGVGLVLWRWRAIAGECGDHASRIQGVYRIRP